MTMTNSSRRSWLTTAAAASIAASLSPLASVILPPPAAASKLPPSLDRAWEAMGGGPADLFFPPNFLGTWDVSSMLVSVTTPLGEKFVPNMASVKRAISDDLNRTARYRVSYIRGGDFPPSPSSSSSSSYSVNGGISSSGGGGMTPSAPVTSSPSSNNVNDVIFDRRYNTASMVSMYYPDVDLSSRIDWDPKDPNILTMRLPGGTSVRSRVTRRSVNVPPGDDHRIETSEYFEQVFDDGLGNNPRVKASQCFTKYKWRDNGSRASTGSGSPATNWPSILKAGEPEIVAFQTVADFLTPYDDARLYIEAANRPVVVYTYRMAFSRSEGQRGDGIPSEWRRGAPTPAVALAAVAATD